MKQLLIVFLVFLWGAHAYAESKITITHAMSLLGDPKYKEGFTHFDYVNPDAPKGGTVTYSTTGSYDSFHRFAKRGVSVVGADGFYDTLMVSSADEIEVYYGLIAEKAEYPDDYTWIIFHLRPEAKFEDGKPITAEDVVFSFNKFFDEGVEQFQRYYSNVKEVVALDKHRVKYSLKEGDKAMLMDLSRSTILPKHFWESRDFGEPLTEVPIMNSNYRISDYKMGQYVVYERIKDYWAQDLPVMRGQSNFDTIRYDYYRDETVELEAFKAGEFDIRQESVSKYWATLYTGPNFDKGYIVKEEIEHDIPQAMQAFTFNTKKTIFRDARVREALAYAMDFEWLNKNLFYDQYTRNRSYFQNSKYEAKGLPSKEELEILEPLRGKISDRVFTEEYQPPSTDGSGNIRSQIRQALRLFKQAGWSIKDKVLVNEKTGEPFEFELIMWQATFERIVIPIQNNLKRMGITMNIRLIDTTQYTRRMREHDYDMISRGFSANYYPDTGLEIVWHSKYVDRSWNAAQVEDPAIDAIVEKIKNSQEDPEALLHLGRALDRVLQWNFYVIPQWHVSNFRVASWDKFARPKIRPKYALGLGTWWIDPEKAKKLPKHKANN